MTKYLVRFFTGESQGAFLAYNSDYLFEDWDVGVDSDGFYASGRGEFSEEDLKELFLHITKESIEEYLVEDNIRIDHEMGEFVIKKLQK